MTDHIPSTSPDPELWDRPKKGPIGELFAPVAGYGVTISSMFRKPATEQYPEEKVPTAPRYHGRHQLNRYPDGLERCIGCELCAWACPADAIFVEAANNTPDNQVSPGERYGRVYQINYLRCIFCGFCIQACPTRALTMTNEYELAGPTREGLVYEKEDLLAPMLEGMLAAPHPMAEGASDADYYRGEVVGPTAAQIEWVAEHRPDDPTLATAVPVDGPASFDEAGGFDAAGDYAAAVPVGARAAFDAAGGFDGAGVAAADVEAAAVPPAANQASPARDDAAAGERTEGGR